MSKECIICFLQLCHRKDANEKNSLWMQLIEGPVHPHSDFQMIQSSVFSDFIDHSRHPCAAQLSGTP